MHSIIAILVFFGAIQGFALCLHLYFKKKDNKRAYAFYALFLFSLSFFNFLYALQLLGINKIGFIPLNAFPFPYKYLIGTAFYFYIKNQIQPTHSTITRMDYLLFLPAIFYGLLRGYWYVMLHSGLDKDIFWRVYESGFFIYNEYIYLSFNLVLTVAAIQFLKQNRSKVVGFRIAQKNWQWMLHFSYAFLIIIIANLILAIIVHAVGDNYSAIPYSILLVLNSVYIYWIGFESLTRSKFLFNTFTRKNQNSGINTTTQKLTQQLEHCIHVDEVFTQKNLKIADLAALLNTSPKTLSQHIHESFGVSFSAYISQLRVEKVKMLLQSEEQEKYTLVAIAEKAGFSSKSSFNAAFKQVTGLTPTQYKATENK